MSAAAPPLVELRNVSKRFERRLDLAGRIARKLGADVTESTVHALDGVSLAVREREVVGLVGESGCGKSTLGRIVSRILAPSAGERYWNGQPYAELDSAALRGERLAVQMIFQDPYASLNPRMRIVDIVGEAPVAHRLIARAEIGCREQVQQLVGARAADDVIGIEPVKLGKRLAQGARRAVGVTREELG